MENNVCMVARALKPSLRGELSMKPSNTQQLFLEELSSVNTQNGAVSVEEYSSVDCFLDFPVGHEEEEEEDEEEKDSVSISSQEDYANSNISASSAFSLLLSTHLDLPEEELAELEWVSRMVDDSSSEFSLLYPAPASKETSPVRFDPETESPALIMTSTSSNNSRRVPFLFPYQLPGKPRTKRARPTSLSQNWSVGPSLTQSSSSSSLTPTSSSVSTPFILSDYNINVGGIVDPVSEPGAKKPKREPMVQFQRRCSHCLVQKTPQWRAGPLGPKTLCNACGVRYKSGRLFPEYRPACSPTFSSDAHSNSHRKVLEMRRRKEMAQPVSGLSQMVPSF